MQEDDKKEQKYVLKIRALHVDILIATLFAVKHWDFERTSCHFDSSVLDTLESLLAE